MLHTKPAKRNDASLTSSSVANQSIQNLLLHGAHLHFVDNMGIPRIDRNDSMFMTTVMCCDLLPAPTHRVTQLLVEITPSTARLGFVLRHL